jgi:Domain of unknown function (DUF4832)/Beta-galactosidase
MRQFVTCLFCLLVWLCSPLPSAFGGAMVTVRPTEIDDVLVNPGMGFMTFHRTDGVAINPENTGYPETSIDYLRVYWNFFEPVRGRYRWEVLDAALKAARDKRQTVLFRIMPYGLGPGEDVPDWYREIVGPEPQRLPPGSWVRTDPEDPRYLEYFGGMVREIGRRYDGHPDLEAMDVSIVGAWGEGAGSAALSQATREALVNSYLGAFRRTPLLMLLTDEKTNTYGISKADVGFRVDCLGDMGGFSPTWSHMLDYYPQAIINFGMADAWKKAPVSFEACWVMSEWHKRGWDINYIIDQSLKWHISSFNGKSSPVPDIWWPVVNRWLKTMGYRFVLRRLSYPAVLPPGGELTFTTWWENKGVAPCYRGFPLALRLKGPEHVEILITSADIRQWLPGDNLYDAAVFLPADMPTGEYNLQIAILDAAARHPKVKLAIAGVQPDGWYHLGKITVQP